MTGDSTLRGRVLVEGEAAAAVLPLTAPLSFWGGVDPRTGTIVDPRHPQHGLRLSGRVVVLPSTVGSSSSSSVLLELFRNGHAPAALLLGAVDPVLTLGAVVATELGYPTCPIVALPMEALEAVARMGTCRVRPDGEVVATP